MAVLLHLHLHTNCFYFPPKPKPILSLPLSPIHHLHTPSTLPPHLSLSLSISLFLSKNCHLQRHIPTHSSVATSCRHPYPYRLHRHRRLHRYPALLHSQYVAGDEAILDREEGEDDEEDDGIVEDEEEEEEEEEGEFVEVGRISSVHGLRGELRVVPSTDFPELRFTKPGKRWLRSCVSGKEVLREIELVSGRGPSSKKTWLVSFAGVDSVDKAMEMVGSYMLVKEEERPFLDEGDFYAPDLKGMTVLLKENRKLIGKVVNVLNFGASDLLRVKLFPSEESVASSSVDNGMPDALVWVPFVEAIVPVVNVAEGEILITPPEGLLELNVRSNAASKKERREQEWREKKKSLRRLHAVKKKLIEIGQPHVIQGLSLGDKSQRASLANQLAEMDLKLLRQALQDITKPTKRYELFDYIKANSAKLENCLEISKNCFSQNLSTDDFKENGRLQKIGFDLLSQQKVAFVLVLDEVKFGSGPEHNIITEDASTYESGSEFAPLDLLDFIKVAKIRPAALIVVCPSSRVGAVKEALVDNDYYGLDNSKVWVLKQQMLPLVSDSLGEEKKYNIVMRSLWDMNQSPVGSGGVLFGLLSSRDIISSLGDIGVEYVQINSLTRRSAIEHPVLLGYTYACDAYVGVKAFEGGDDEFYEIILSMPFMKKLAKQPDVLNFFPLEGHHLYDKMVGAESSESQSTNKVYHLRTSIYNILRFCSPEKLSLLRII